MNAALRRRNLVWHLHQLGERTVDVLLEVAKAHDIEADIIARLERYGQLSRDTLAALGADRSPPLPLHLVEDAA
jgi:hypothetical protein